MPVLAALQEEFADGVCMGSSAEDAREVVGEMNTGAMALGDGDMTTQSPYHANPTPSTYLIDGDGAIRMSDVGYGDGTEA